MQVTDGDVFNFTETMGVSVEWDLLLMWRDKIWENLDQFHPYGGDEAPLFRDEAVEPHRTEVSAQKQNLNIRELRLPDGN